MEINLLSYVKWHKYPEYNWLVVGMFKNEEGEPHSLVMQNEKGGTVKVPIEEVECLHKNGKIADLCKGEDRWQIIE